MYVNWFRRAPACCSFDIPWVRSWAADNSLLALREVRRWERELWSWSEGLNGGLCLAGRQVWWVTGTRSRGTRWPGGGSCQWGEGTLCHSVHLQPVSGFWQSRDVRPAVTTRQPAVMRRKFKLGKGWVEIQPCTWCCVDVQRIGGSQPNRIWEYG